ncbi:MAG: hypothetical protein KDC27_16180, partial [Acidobacteria bacterium]|nr:hypothetical protein [Acidobacteriota bacterium]
GMVIRIPISELPPRPDGGYDRLIVLGASAGSDHGEAFKSLLDAHRYTRGLDFLEPGEATNATEESPEPAGAVSVQTLFETEFAHRKDDGGKPEPRSIHNPESLLRGKPENSLATTFGLAGETAADRAPSAGNAAADLALAANRALWPATLGKYFTDPFSKAGGGAPVLSVADLDFLREWFTDYVRPDGPLPTLRVGRQPYGLLPVSELARREADAQTDHLANFILDVFEQWYDLDRTPVLDPDASDTRPRPNQAAEQASDVGAIYGAVPHIHEIRLRSVDDAYRDLTDTYNLRIGVLGLLCALVPKQIVRDPNTGEVIDIVLPAPEDLDTHPWYKIFAEREADAKGASGVQGQIDALTEMRDELDEASGDEIQEIAAFRAIKYIDKFAKHFHSNDPDWPSDDSIPSGDLLGLVFRQQGRTAHAQTYLAPLGIKDHLGAERAPRLYSAGFEGEGTETDVKVLVSQGSDDEAVADLTQRLTELRDAAQTLVNGGAAPDYDFSEPLPFLHQLLRSAVATVTGGSRALPLKQGLDCLLTLVEERGAAAIPELERLLQSALGPAMYRADAWITSLATRRLADQRVKRASGLQIGGYGWLVNLEPRAGKASQGFIHTPTLDHAVSAAVLRSGWSAFGTDQGGSPLAVNLSSERVRAAKSLIEGVRSGHELGRLLGQRFERRLHDRGLDRHIDDTRAAVLAGAGKANRPPTRIVDGLLLARAFTKGVELTGAEQNVFSSVEDFLVGADDETRLRNCIDETVGDLDAVADLLFSQAVHSLLRGDAGVAAPTLAATGSGDSGLPAIDFPKTERGGRLVTLRVIATFGPGAVSSSWPAAAQSVRAAAEPRLEQWAAQILGPPAKAIFDIESAGATRRLSLHTQNFGALDAIYRADDLGADILLAEGIPDGRFVAGRPVDLEDDELSFDEFLTLARSLRGAFGRIRPLADSDFETEQAGSSSWDATDLAQRLAIARTLVPPGDPRLEQLAQHEADNPGATVELLIERLHILTVQPIPILPILANGAPSNAAGSFRARGGAAVAPEWFLQASKTRPALADLASAVQMAELVQDRALLRFALAQTPDDDRGPWAGLASPSGEGSHLCWCSLTGDPPAGPLAGFVVDSWTETIPETRIPTGIAVHFDRPSASAPNAVLLMVTPQGQSFSLDYVSRSLSDTLKLVQFRAHGPDEEHAFLGQFLPAVYLPGDLAVLERTGDNA